jgi:predicted porin
MNKKLLTLAVGAAISSAPMFANAAVTVYGSAHLSIDSLDDGGATDSKLLTLASNSSFIGFKAEEDLGGGLKAIFGAEWQVGLDNANTNGTGSSTTTFAPTSTATSISVTDTTGIANRNVFVGLQGGFGTVRLGQYDDIVKNVGRAVDFFHSEQIGENRALTAANSMDARLANSVRYDSPKLGPVTLTAQYGMANDMTESAGLDLTAFAVGAQMDMGGLYVGAAYKSRDVDAGTTTDQTKAYRVSASYTIGAFKVGGLYQNFQNDVPATDVDLSVYGVGASFKIGNGVIKGQYYVAGDSTGVGAGSTDGATLMAIGYDHNLSKNTFVYVTYAMVDNDTAGTYSVIGAGHANPNDTSGFGATPDESNGGISLGMKMKF